MRRRRTSLYASGMTPDGAESVLMDLMSLCRSIESISRTEFVDCSSYADLTYSPRWVSEQQQLPLPTCRGLLAPVVSLLATIAGVEIEEYQHPASPPLPPNLSIYPPSTSRRGRCRCVPPYRGYLGRPMPRNRRRFLLGGRPRSSMRRIWPPFVEPSGYRLAIGSARRKSTPICMSVVAGRTGRTSSSAGQLIEPVECRSGVCEAPSGIRNVLDLPRVTGPMRGLSLVRERDRASSRLAGAIPAKAGRHERAAPQTPDGRQTPSTISLEEVSAHESDAEACTNPVPHELLSRIVEAATICPSGNLRRNSRFYVITVSEKIKEISGLWSRIYELFRRHADEIPDVTQVLRYMIEHFRNVPAVVFAGATDLPGQKQTIS